MQRRRLPFRFGWLFVGLALAFNGEAEAATATANLNVSCSISSTCTITTVALAFGAYDPVVTNASTPLTGTGTVRVTCTSGASTTVTLGQGTYANTGSSDTVPLRRMRDSGTNYLSYYLYQDASYTTVWGNTAPTGVGHTGSGSITNLTVYGRVTQAQNVPSGSYSDVVVATITF
ncbi:MAG: spore coat U domain-containing protein [Polyangiaceae bacterium]